MWIELETVGTKLVLNVAFVWLFLALSQGFAANLLTLSSQSHKGVHSTSVLNCPADCLLSLN